MTSETDDLPLAADFAPATSADWRRLVDSVLKGAPFERLVGRTYDDLAIEPIYPRATGASPLAGRAAASPWQIMQRMDHPDPAKANAQALHDLENGATGLDIDFARGWHSRGFGLIDDSAETLKRAFETVVFDAGISIALNPASWHGDNAGVNLAALIAERGIDPGRVDLRFNYQPLSVLAASGTGGNVWPDIGQEFAKTVRALMSRGFKGPFVLADGCVVHDAGGSEAQELAFTLASAVTYLRALEAAGVDLDLASKALSFRLTADADQFLTITKFRALRLLWARVEEACGLTPKPIFIAAETAWRMLTRRDPYVNMLRATVATFSAGLGGANAITVLPHTLALGLPDAFARRVARNTQLILLEESNLAKVADPAAGSGGIEALTRQLCDTAWSLFQEIEKAGGVLAALQRGLIQDKVRATCRAREANIARRRDVLTGASEFPNLQEASVAVEDQTSFPTSPLHPDALHAMRLAGPFENLRDLSDAILKTRGKRPSVLLANLGTAADFTARASFTRSFFEAGGIAAIDSEGFSDPAALAAAYKVSAADLVCLCSSDKIYATAALEAAKALQSAGARHIYLAGRPGEQETALRDAGVAEFIFAGADAPKLLRDAYRQMELI
jgi:methylmalonyl-CoA mutase